jgi:hypothetical protein
MTMVGNYDKVAREAVSQEMSQTSVMSELVIQ